MFLGPEGLNATTELQPRVQAQGGELARERGVWVAQAAVELRPAHRSKRARGDLHDRFVRAHFADVDTVVWDIGCGIQGVVSAKWSCVVNAFHETAADRTA